MLHSAGNPAVFTTVLASSFSLALDTGTLLDHAVHDHATHAGQSNMEVPLDETFEWYHREVSNDTDYPLRLMTFPHVNGLNDSTIHVNDDKPIPWLESNYENLNKFSSVCYYFGKALHKRMAADGQVVPVGLVKNCWGGSLIEAWVPQRDANGETYCTDRKVREGRTPGKLFNSMITPVSNATIKGWLWYQVGQFVFYSCWCCGWCTLSERCGLLFSGRAKRWQPG